MNREASGASSKSRAWVSTARPPIVTANGAGDGSTSLYDRQAAALSQATTFAQLIDTPDIISAVKSDLQLSLSDSDIRAKISAVAPSQQTLVIISATDKNADTAAAAVARSAARGSSSRWPRKH